MMTLSPRAVWLKLMTPGTLSVAPSDRSPLEMMLFGGLGPITGTLNGAASAPGSRNVFASPDRGLGPVIASGWLNDAFWADAPNCRALDASYHPNAYRPESS
jgi:hypothetical protein